MAHSVSAKKRARQGEKHRVYNKSYVSKIKTLAKKIETSVAQKDISAAKNDFKTYTHFVDRAVAKGVYKKNTAARRKSRLALRIRAAETQGAK